MTARSESIKIVYFYKVTRPGTLALMENSHALWQLDRHVVYYIILTRKECLRKAQKYRKAFNIATSNTSLRVGTSNIQVMYIWLVFETHITDICKRMLKDCTKYFYFRQQTTMNITFTISAELAASRNIIIQKDTRCLRTHYLFTGLFMNFGSFNDNEYNLQSNKNT